MLRVENICTSSEPCKFSCLFCIHDLRAVHALAESMTNAVHWCNIVQLDSVCNYIQSLVIVPHSGKDEVIHRHEVGYLQLSGWHNFPVTISSILLWFVQSNEDLAGPQQICKSWSLKSKKNNLHKNRQKKKVFAHLFLLTLLIWITSRGLPALNL